MLGRITLQHLKDSDFPEASQDIYIAFSGPKGMNQCVRQILCDNQY